MDYINTIIATFVSRKNRFIGIVEIDGQEEEVHIANTGRGSEVFLPGVPVVLEPARNPNRKTRYTLVSIYKGDRLINIDSQAPNKLAYEALTEGIITLDCQLTLLVREKTYGQSRFDFYYEGLKDGELVKGFIEAKGVTLEIHNMGLFPDAPTLRGLKHLNELKEAQTQGYQNYVLFVVQMSGVSGFMPNYPMQPEFAETLYNLEEAGVRILAYDTLVTPDYLKIDQLVPFQRYPIGSDKYILPS